ncbi:T9SS type A sorting domain-containing protein [Flavobacterium sp. TP390]|uniref:T9SS type A sorting domain-containing protein n=1 Tax=Flavobacterium profundi TaxID=1774945 RepID=A0A6I4IEY3_9FLAO|nr:T9SS type A sorting domain-containing protein [Flavobacterium profundi]MVO08154.1 T9SS type A sorting domain-containing protein [Flavobacterium profundi]
MKQFYTFLLLACSFLVQAQIVTIPDANFKSKLLSASSSNRIAKNLNGNYTRVDLDNNGEIDLNEAHQIKELDVSYSSISDLTGLESFSSLEILYARFNTITTVDISQNINLKNCYISSNQITSFDVSQNVNLVNLDLGYNHLTNIDLTQNTNLESLDIGGSVLNNIDISQNLALKYLNVNGTNISNLDVTQHLGLLNLSIAGNPITNINLQNNILLESLFINQNQVLTGIDLTYNTALKNLTLSNVPFNTFDLSTLTNLTNLYLVGDNLNTIDLSQNTALKLFKTSGNNFSTIDLTNNVNLEVLDISNNPIVNIDLSQNTKLNEIRAVNTLLTVFDLSYSNFLRNIQCYDSPQLEYINIKNGMPSLPFYNLFIRNCPNLRYICCDEDQVNFVQQQINNAGYASVCNLNTYCSFVPNGTYYEVTGNVALDLNNDGCNNGQDDVNVPNLKFQIVKGQNTGFIISNGLNNYNLPLIAGNYTITPQMENPNYFVINPNTISVDFPVQNSPYIQDFCFTPNGQHSDLEVFVFSTIPARPGFDAKYKIVYRNKGNKIENGQISLTYEDTVLDFVSAVPSYNSATTDLLSWNFSNLQPFETREIEVILNVNSPMENPAVNIADVLTYSVNISTANVDEMPNDNSFQLNQTVVGSYDPNDKTCLEGEKITSNEVGNYVYYIIRFENTGTYPAENIVIKDVIDINKFDLNTIVPLKGSHEYFTRINSNTVEFIFENINLDFNDAFNDGYVVFKIKSLPNLQIGDSFSNSANIYFDYNFPIVTNTYTTVVENTLHTNEFDFDSVFSIYPNPATELLNIDIANNLKVTKIEIFNILNQVVFTGNHSMNSINISNLESGTYFIKVSSENGAKTIKIIKR